MPPPPMSNRVKQDIMQPLILGIMAYFSKEDVDCWHSIQQKDGCIFSHAVPFIYWVNPSSFAIFCLFI